MKNIKILKLNDVIYFKGRFYRVELSKWSNGNAQGDRVYLKLLKDKEIIEITFNQKMKGGLKENEK